MKVGQGSVVRVGIVWGVGYVLSEYVSCKGYGRKPDKAMIGLVWG